MTGSETSAAGPVVSPGQALEFVAGASALLARSLSSGYDDPALEAVLLEIRRRRREATGASESRA